MRKIVHGGLVLYTYICCKYTDCSKRRHGHFHTVSVSMDSKYVLSAQTRNKVGRKLISSQNWR